MSEFPEWAERDIGLYLMSYEEARAYVPPPDPRGSKEPIWWRQLWLFDRRRRSWSPEGTAEPAPATQPRGPLAR